MKRKPMTLVKKYIEDKENPNKKKDMAKLKAFIHKHNYMRDYSALIILQQDILVYNSRIAEMKQNIKNLKIKLNIEVEYKGVTKTLKTWGKQSKKDKALANFLESKKMVTYYPMYEYETNKINKTQNKDRLKNMKAKAKELKTRLETSVEY